jgi:energy-coupling factor transport system ATP-binding protein
MIELKNFSVSFKTKTVLQDLNLCLADGKRLEVLGSNGSGKSTFALALANVIPDFIEANVSGQLLCENASLIMQSPTSQFFAMSVKEELGSAISLAKEFGLQDLLERSVFQLSEGEKQKINLVASLSFNPDAILLDEPLELLDPLEAAKFRQLLEKDKQRTTIWFDKEKAGLQKAAKFFLGKQKNPIMPKSNCHIRTGLALKADFSLRKNGFRLNAGFSLRNGEKIALIGRNGCGKTTVLKAIAGIENFKGSIEKPGFVSFVPQNPSHLFFKETAGAELPEKKNAARLGLNRLLGQNPNSLSKGQQKLLSVATIRSKGLALLDEPTTWLDAENKAAVYNFISDSSQPMVIATHDKQLLNYCDRIFLVEGGEVQECSSTAVSRFFLK